MSMAYTDKYRDWMARLPENDPLMEEMKEIEGDHRAVRERFQLDLSFGTAGLRGIVGAGTNRMNYYTVGRATQGIANFIVKKGKAAMNRGVVIAHDPRHF
ncbi:MAG: phospho-sugar mutase, partial [Solobacterium sp.]|nr:phospho-sugar mutase [Solobacterium sp.]